MFIPDQNFFNPGSASKNLSILTQTIVSKLSEIWSGLFSPDPHPWSGSRFFTHTGSWIQGSKRHRIPDPDPQTQFINVAENGRGATPCWTCCRCPCCPPPPSPYTTGTAPPMNRTRHAPARAKLMGTCDRRRMPCHWTGKHGLFCLLRIYAQISTWTGRGMRQHVLNGWEHVIVDECHATGWESMSGLPDSCFVKKICADKYMKRMRHAPARDGNTWSCHQWRESMDKSPSCRIVVFLRTSAQISTNLPHFAFCRLQASRGRTWSTWRTCAEETVWKWRAWFVGYDISARWAEQSTWERPGRGIF